MAVVAGVGASVKIGSTTVGQLDTWTLNIKGEVADTTQFGSTGNWHTRTPTLKDWDCKIKGRMDAADGGQLLLTLSALNTTVTVHLLTGDSTHEWNGSAILVGISPQAPVAGVVLVEYDFVGTGALSYV